MGSSTEALAVGAAACLIAAALVLVRMELLRGAPPWLTAPLSEHAAGRRGLYYRALVVLSGAGTALLVVVLDRDGHASTRGLVFLGVFAAARIAIAAVPADRPGREPTRRGQAHIGLAAAAFTSIAYGAADVTGTLVDTGNWSGGVAGPLRFMASAIIGLAVLTAAAYLVPWLRERLFGGAERLLVAASLAWLLLAALHAVALAG
jgi:hypothetical protein